MFLPQLTSEHKHRELLTIGGARSFVQTFRYCFNVCSTRKVLWTFDKCKIIPFLHHSSSAIRPTCFQILLITITTCKSAYHCLAGSSNPSVPSADNIDTIIQWLETRGHTCLHHARHGIGVIPDNFFHRRILVFTIMAYLLILTLRKMRGTQHTLKTSGFTSSVKRNLVTLALAARVSGFLSAYLARSTIDSNR
jgi:hypothetical protein